MTTQPGQIKNEAPTLEEVIRLGVQNALFDLNTAMPGIVQSYDNLTNTANVQPVFRRTYTDDGEGNTETVDAPIINKVPVAFPRANQAAITFPIRQGDTVLLIFSQRTLDRWKTVGGKVTPGDPRTHALSDAIAIPGVYPATNPVLIDPDNLVIRHILSKITVKKDAIEVASGAGKITVDSTGKLTLGNGVIELLDLVDKLMEQVNATLTAITSITVPTAVGPSGTPNNAASFISAKTQVTALKTKLGFIKG